MNPRSRISRRLTTILLTATLILSSAGCFILIPDEDEEDPYLTEAQMVDKGMAYLEERYGIDFDVKSISAGGMFGEIPTGLNVTTPLYPDMIPLGVYWERVDGVDNFFDDFIYTIVEPEYQAIVQNLVASHFPVNFTYAILDGPTRSPAEFNKDTTFEQFHAWALDSANVTTVISIPTMDAADYEIKADLLKIQLQQVTSKGALRVVVLTPDNYEQDIAAYPVRNQPGVVWPMPEESRVEHEWEA